MQSVHERHQRIFNGIVIAVVVLFAFYGWSKWSDSCRSERHSARREIVSTLSEPTSNVERDVREARKQIEKLYELIDQGNCRQGLSACKAALDEVDSSLSEAEMSLKELQNTMGDK